MGDFFFFNNKLKLLDEVTEDPYYPKTLHDESSSLKAEFILRQRSLLFEIRILYTVLRPSGFKMR